MGIKEAAGVAGVHYVTLYEWLRRYEAIGEEAFLSYKPASPERGVKKISTQQEEATLSTAQVYCFWMRTGEEPAATTGDNHFNQDSAG
ncbi:MAG: helix-turn-helix domain-containing protein [Deltaproteobacteria bacterium]|nr:helix-turn-helix domain-containing protein [Deltaproteobacteria bacterium]